MQPTTGPAPARLAPRKTRLESKLFTADAQARARLEACLNSDAAHVVRGAVGDHVSKIQSALFVLLSDADIPAKELGERRYGPRTAAAVLRYKQDRAIVNPAYQRAADDIVGRLTIERLDNEMLAKEKGSDVPPPPVPSGKFRFITSGGSAAEAGFRPIRIKFQADDPNKEDMENQPVNRFVPAAKAKRIVQGLLALDAFDEATCKQKLLSMTGRGGAMAREMAEFFINNHQARATRAFNQGSFWSRQVASDAAFLASHTKLSFAIKDALQQLADEVSGNAKTIDLSRLADTGKQPSRLADFATDISFAFQSDPNRFLRGDPLAFAIGDIQGLAIHITTFRGRPEGDYDGTLSYVLADHYGSDDGDVVDPGQASLWLLQRKMASKQSANGCEPYRVQIAIDGVSFSGQLR